MSLTPQEVFYDWSWMEVCKRRNEGKEFGDEGFRCVCGYHRDGPLDPPFSTEELNSVRDEALAIREAERTVQAYKADRIRERNEE